MKRTVLTFKTPGDYPAKVQVMVLPEGEEGKVFLLVFDRPVMLEKKEETK